MKNISPKNLVLLLLLSILWAGTFIFVKIADRDLDPLTIMTIRGVLSTLFLFIVLPLTGKPLFKYFKKISFQLVCCCSGALIAYMWLTIAYSEKVISAAMASFLLTALVPFTWIIATFITREKMFYGINFLGIIIATLGIIIVLGFKNIFHVDNELWATLLYLSGLATFAAAATINKKFAHAVNPLTTITFNLFYMSIILTVISFLFGNPIAADFTRENIIALIGLAFFSTGIGYLIYFYLSHHAGLVFAAQSTYLVPMLGFVMGLLLLHEKFMVHQISGLLVIFMGMWLIQKRRRY